MRRGIPLAAVGAAVIAALLGAGAAVASVSSAASGSSASSVGVDVSAYRVLSGRAYGEYLAARRALGPLPAGFAWPVGVPAQSGYGAVDNGLLRPGSGTDAAYFTYLCAWESEFLSAIALGRSGRADDAARALSRFFDTAWARRVSPDGIWAAAVSLPIRDGNYAGVRYDRAGTCRRAGLAVSPG